VVFTNVLTPRGHISRKHEYQPTLVRCRATIGANATIVCGVVIGRYAFVGAGAVVTHDVPDHALWYGNPARRHGWMCECGVGLPDPGQQEIVECRACHRQFVPTERALLRAGTPTDEAAP
jgi:UDP-2-acetamido-3-amino-2,3-dideoxy-glucuronate N-acetyltransferase